MDREYYTYADFRADLQPPPSAAEGPTHLVADMRTPRQSGDKRPPKNRRMPRRKPHRTLRTVFVVLCLFVVLASLMLLLSDFLLPRGILGYVVETFAPAPNYVYAVSAGSFDTLTEARATSDGVRARGGAGFIAYDGHYRVLLSAYPDQSSAQSVAEKHGYTVYPMRTDGLEADDFPLAYRSAAKPLEHYHVDIYRQLYDVSDQLAQGGAIAYARARVEAIREALRTKAESFLAATEYATDATTQNFRATIEAVLASLDNLITQSTDATFPTDLRWTYIMVLRINRIG